MTLKRTILTLICLCAVLSPAFADRTTRGVTDFNAKGLPFAPKGMWSVGGSAGFSTNNADNHSILVVNNINWQGYKVTVKPTVMYTLFDDFCIGGSLNYRRSGFDLASAGLDVAGFALNVNDYDLLGQSFGASLIVRKYLTIGKPGRFAIYLDGVLSGSGGQNKVTDKQNGNIIGTYSENYKFGFDINAGLAAFITDSFMMSAGVGILGVDYNWGKQIMNQVSDARHGMLGASFSVDLLALQVGLFYCF